VAGGTSYVPLIEVVSLGGEIVIGPGVNVADTPAGTCPSVMWSQVVVALHATVGATMAATRTSATIEPLMILLTVDPLGLRRATARLRSRVLIVLALGRQR
jgi:hypothetical protein